MNNILTFCFVSDGVLPRTALELLAGARQLVEERGSGRVQVLVCGADLTQADVVGHADTLAAHGADDLFEASHHSLQPYNTGPLLDVVDSATRQLDPAILLLPHDIVGSELGARLAYRLETGIVTDCTGFRIEDETVQWLKPVYGGKAVAAVVCEGRPQIVTLRSRAFEPLPADSSRRSTITTIVVHPPTPQATPATTWPIIQRELVCEPVGAVPLDQAQIVVGGGRGLGHANAFAQLEELAQVLGGAVGGSRPAADSGWVSHSQLIGQTGKIVAPDLYIAIGISGAPQHMVGAGAAQTIVAINKDPDAPIFKSAHLGVVDEWQNVVPALVEACRELLARGDSS